MQSLFTWIAGGLGTLFFAACVVAWWEHLGRDVKRTDDPDWDAPPRPFASVDIELDALSPLPPSQAPPGSAGSAESGDLGERQQALGGAMSRMASADRRQGFRDTVPMILAGGPPETDRNADRDAAREAAEAVMPPAPPAERRQRARATADD